MTERAPDSVARLEQLLQRLEEARAELERTDDAEQAVNVLRELAEVAKEVQAEIERARREEGR
jgi:putative NADPH-quinone reductase